MDKKAKERVAIAKDAMEWVKAGALRPERMVYGESPIHRKWQLMQEDTLLDRQLRDINLGECKVCALGALFLAKAVRYDDVTVRDFCAGDDVLRDKLATHGFSSSQLRLIEEAFEIWGDNAASAFGRRYADSKSRMLAILQNIIDNNGTFVP